MTNPTGNLSPRSRDEDEWRLPSPALSPNTPANNRSLLHGPVSPLNFQRLASGSSAASTALLSPTRPMSTNVTPLMRKISKTASRTLNLDDTRSSFKMYDSLGDEPFPEKKPFRTFVPLIPPDASLFPETGQDLYSVTDHAELLQARGLASPSTPKPPAAPAVIKYNRLPWDQSPFLRHSLQYRKTLLQYAEAQKQGPIKPFTIPIDAKRWATVHSIKQLQGGNNSIVFKCELSGDLQGAYVLKLITGPLKETPAGNLYEDPRDVMTRAGNQLRRYAEYAEIPFLNSHTAPHANFDPLLTEVAHLLQIEDEDERGDAFREFLMNRPYPVCFVPYIPNPLPVDWDSSSSVWKQVQTLFRVAHRNGVAVDARRSNLRVDEKGRVLLTDLFELNEEFPQVLYRELIATLVPDKQGRLIDPREDNKPIRRKPLFPFKSGSGKKME